MNSNDPITKRHKAWYGDVQMERMYCEQCKEMCLVVKGRKQCCDRPTKTRVSKACVEYITPPEKRRISLSKKQKKAMIEDQGNRCFYCLREFGSAYLRNGVVKSLKVHFDHINPYVMTYNNQKENYVASCNVCNLLKSSKVFSTIEEIREYVYGKQKTKGYSFL